MPSRLARLASMLRNGIAAWGVVVFALMFCRNDLGIAAHDLPAIIFGGFGVVVLVQAVRALVRMTGATVLEMALIPHIDNYPTSS